MNSDNRQILNPDRRLRAGCYYLHFEPTYPYWGDDDPPEDREREVVTYGGTMRVVHYNNAGDKALTLADARKGKAGQVLYLSGDLYALPPARGICFCKDIPIFPIKDYRFYLLATDIEPGDNGEFTLCLKSYEFSGGALNPCGIVRAILRWTEAPTGSHSAFDYLEGFVWDENDNLIGAMSLNWVSEYLRSAVLEIDQVNDVRIPRDSDGNFPKGEFEGVPHRTWEGVFEDAGWKMEVMDSQQPAESPTKIWSEPELHQALPTLLDSTDVDHEWRYHIFCVGQLDDGGRGYEFDADGGQVGCGLFDSVALAAKYEFTGNDSENEEWGNLAEKTLDETPIYFRTAVHEIGHALGLEHNFSTGGFMSTTDSIQQIAENLVKRNGNIKVKGKSNHQINVLDAIKWEFAPDDLQRLRHWPDLVVRPGCKAPKFSLPGVDDFRILPLYGGVDEEPTEKIELHFALESYLQTFPLGAPVRILLELRNTGKERVKVPDLRLKSGNITGTVESRSGEQKSFAPLAGRMDELGVVTLGPDETIKGSMALLGGPDGALFPDPGSYTVTVRLRVYRDRKYFELSKATEVWVAPFADDAQRRIATLLLRTKATLVNFAIGDGLAEGDQAINLALNNSVLGPHYAIIALKRLCRDIGRVNVALVKLVIGLGNTQEPILTESEVEGLIGIVRSSLGMPSAREAHARYRKGAPSYFDQLKLESVITYALQADLKWVGTRIVLGHLNDDSLHLFVHAIQEDIAKQRKTASSGNGAPRGSKNLNAATAKDILRKFLTERIGLTPLDSNELTGLFLEGGNAVIDAILNYDPHHEVNKTIRHAFAQVGISLETLARAMSHFQMVVKENRRSPSQNKLFLIGRLIVESLREKEVPIKGELGAAFRMNLEDNLKKAGLLEKEKGKGSEEDDVSAWRRRGGLSSAELRRGHRLVRDQANEK